MAIQNVTNEYAIPRGRTYLDKLVSGVGEGEVAVGNVPGFAISIESTKADHYSSESGLRQKDKTITIEVNRTAQITIDNFTLENLAYFLSGEVETITQAAGAATTETITVKQGRTYQLGKTASLPAGSRDISAVTVEPAGGGTAFVEGTDYNLDLALGRLQIIVGGGIADDTSIDVDYTKAAATWQRVKTGSSTELQVSIRVLADNASGGNRDYYMPLVNLTPSGDLPVIQDGTDFVSMTFDADIQKPSNGEAIYVDGRPV